MPDPESPFDRGPVVRFVVVLDDLPGEEVVQGDRGLRYPSSNATSTTIQKWTGSIPFR